VPTNEEITRHHDEGRPDSDAWVDDNRHRQPVVRDIYDRMFRPHGLLP
jgi:hypothetical protein